MRKGYRNEILCTPELTVNPYRSFFCRFRKFRGPEDGLLDIRFEQFMHLQHYLDAMNLDPNKLTMFWPVYGTQAKHSISIVWRKMLPSSAIFPTG
ncbi:hypothetical protein NXY01_14285 [Bacteroides fragilis]|nr:hypothetical protein NXY01_14285 [Bacteroides fragilis]